MQVGHLRSSPHLMLVGDGSNVTFSNQVRQMAEVRQQRDDLVHELDLLKSQLEMYQSMERELAQAKADSATSKQQQVALTLGCSALATRVSL